MKFYKYMYKWKSSCLKSSIKQYWVVVVQLEYDIKLRNNSVLVYNELSNYV